ncbi:helix-turn-helix domain-containing protein [Halolamina sp. C58]|uniref:helix-turn-helix domain-containing protein n=1 Tax=Halolamina sp. C58 TaxID=3421640 RepID=UPI003EBDDD71
MSLIAELRLADAQLVLRPSLEAAPGMTLKREWATAADRTADPMLFVWASGGDFEAFEAALPEDPTIGEHECIDDRGDRRLYRVTVNREVTTNPTPIDRETGASRLSIETTVDGAVLEVRLPNREALSEYISRLRESGFTVDLLRAHDADDGGGSEYGLSEKQTEALREALHAGYYEVPRETDLGTLAEEFDISEQALSERLRRGVSSVLAATVGEPTEPRVGIEAETSAAVGGAADDE